MTTKEPRKHEAERQGVSRHKGRPADFWRVFDRIQEIIEEYDNPELIERIKKFRKEEEEPTKLAVTATGRKRILQYKPARMKILELLRMNDGNINAACRLFRIQGKCPNGIDTKTLYKEMDIDSSFKDLVEIAIEEGQENYAKWIKAKAQSVETKMIDILEGWTPPKDEKGNPDIKFKEYLEGLKILMRGKDKVMEREVKETLIKESTTIVQHQEQLDWSKLTTEELRTYRDLHAKLIDKPDDANKMVIEDHSNAPVAEFEVVNESA